MYKIEKIPQEDFAKATIPNRERIIQYHKNPLNPKQGYELIKKETKDFTVANPKAEEADKLLYLLLRPQEKQKSQKQQVPTAAKISIAELQMKEKERARALALLELELELEMENAKKTA